MEQEVDLHRHTHIVQSRAAVDSKVIWDMLTIDNIRNGPTVRTPVNTRLDNTKKSAVVGHDAINTRGQDIAVTVVSTLVRGKNKRSALLYLPAEVSCGCEGSVDREKDKISFLTLKAHRTKVKKSSWMRLSSLN